MIPSTMKCKNIWNPTLSRYKKKIEIINFKSESDEYQPTHITNNVLLLN